MSGLPTSLARGCEMAQKNATPSRIQQASMRAAGLDPNEWVVVKELITQMIIRNRDTNEHRLINHKPKRLEM